MESEGGRDGGAGPGEDMTDCIAAVMEDKHGRIGVAVFQAQEVELVMGQFEGQG